MIGAWGSSEWKTALKAAAVTVRLLNRHYGPFGAAEKRGSRRRPAVERLEALARQAPGVGDRNSWLIDLGDHKHAGGAGAMGVRGELQLPVAPAGCSGSRMRMIRCGPGGCWSGPLQQVAIVSCGPQLDPTRFARPVALRLGVGQGNTPQNVWTLNGAQSERSFTPPPAQAPAGPGGRASRSPPTAARPARDPGQRVPPGRGRASR